MCGCNKKSVQNKSFRPVVGPRPVRGGITAGASPERIRALTAQNTTTGPRQIERMDNQRRRIEQIRRAAIKRKSGG